MAEEKINDASDDKSGKTFCADLNNITIGAKNEAVIIEVGNSGEIEEKSDYLKD